MRRKMSITEQFKQKKKINMQMHIHCTKKLKLFLKNSEMFYADIKTKKI